MWSESLKCATATCYIPHDSQTPHSIVSFLGAICRDLNPICCARTRGRKGTNSALLPLGMPERIVAATTDPSGHQVREAVPSTRPPPSQNIEYSLLHVAALVSCRPSSPDSPTQSTHNSIPWASSPCAPPRATVGSPDIGRTSPRPLHGHSPPQRVGQQVNLEASLAGRSRGNLSPISDKSLENAGTSITEEAKDVERSRFGRPNEK
jgi:hypothetical protein